MNSLDIWLLAVALAMDCLTVSIVSGVIIRRWLLRTVLRMAFLFGLFQAMMPLLGWLATNHFSEQLEAVDHWIAFGLLAFLGGKMIRESLSDEEEHHFNPQILQTQLLLAVATSIDALAIGISFACTGYRQLSQLSVPLFIIGIVSFLFSVIGNWLGIRFGKSIARRLRPELLGGIILIVIGIKILFSHIFGIG
ncbi:MAG: manganese efflux pump [Prevotella sp.]|nr:manganese efflux pump [Prevotella sp.]